jgi:hypothetical protein
MTEEQKPSGDIFAELRTLGQQLGTAIKALWEADETRHVRQEIQQGFVELGQHIDGAIKTAQDSAAAKQFGEQVKQTVDKAKESDVATQLEQGIVTGLQELNKQLGSFVDSWTKPGQPPTPPPAEPGPNA